MGMRADGGGLTKCSVYDAILIISLFVCLCAFIFGILFYFVCNYDNDFLVLCYVISWFIWCNCSINMEEWDMTLRFDGFYVFPIAKACSFNERDMTVKIL